MIASQDDAVLVDADVYSFLMNRNSYPRQPIINPMYQIYLEKQQPSAPAEEYGE